MKKIAIICLAIAISTVATVGISQYVIAEASRAEERITSSHFSQSENELGEVILAELQNKLGGNLQYTIDQNTGNLTFLKSQGGGIPITMANSSSLNGVGTANLFMEEYGALFGINNSATDLSMIKETTDELGMKHIRYGQRYSSVPVFGGEIIVHLNNNLTVASANGKAVPNISLRVLPSKFMIKC
ncbi:MAG: hypothetical protein COT24_02585 [Candidatus Kerfeldbacteria bacterium CG08_land_8_20_14_0_20_40_16]|uniref:FTP domain-containing protein n=1 Tax=Candidatus Kerfeldbacteria bacterium CG08_land_8_20_14_0_20_40_16 TaxID=2014244 RepID=A0A2H0YW02_9BACT|nr:MAG: hypothetical protein COT24_02585 [Candidatus Kerfeldbacteria bacterium CG08_land_8_20_14_0_20_40_16]